MTIMIWFFRSGDFGSVSGCEDVYVVRLDGDVDFF